MMNPRNDTANVKGRLSFLLVGCFLLAQVLLLVAYRTSGDLDEGDVQRSRHMLSDLPSHHPQDSATAEPPAVVHLWVPEHRQAYQPDREVRASKRLFQEMPKGHRKTFYSHSSKICHVMIRALRATGWTRVNNADDAQLLWTYTRKTEWYPELESWQRYNHVPRTYVWNHKDKMAAGFQRYQERTGVNLYFLPKTYNLNDPSGVKRFMRRLFQKGGMEQPWVLKEPNVNQGKGITMLAPNSEALKQSYMKGREGDYIIQQYICNEMTWDGRKFDTRMFWFVASMDPLLVFYMDGYARVGNAKYTENNFTNTRDHLTTHTFLGEEGKGSFAELSQRVTARWKADPKLQARIPDPVAHVKSQYKETIGRLIDAFKDGTFQAGDPLSAEDSFELYGADFIIDNDLDVWLVEAQDDCGMDEDHYFRLEMHHNIYYGMATILEEIWDKQEREVPILPVQNTGIWELVYADGWVYEYEGYDRTKVKKQCE